MRGTTGTPRPDGAQLRCAPLAPRPPSHRHEHDDVDPGQISSKVSKELVSAWAYAQLHVGEVDDQIAAHESG